MEQQRNKKQAAQAGESREDRLKAALKANMAKRKAQARARKAADKNEADKNG